MWGVCPVTRARLAEIDVHTIGQLAKEPGWSLGTSVIKAEMASNILACAAKGERNPEVLKALALLVVVDVSHYSHDISPERRAV